MKKLLLFPILFLLFISTQAQRLLTWAPEFPTDNTGLVITADCNKGSQGLLNFEGGMSSNVYVHVGVITNLSTGPNDWKYVKFPWGTATAAANAIAIAPNKYQFTIPNIRTFFNVPAAETIIKVNVIFRNTGGTLKQVNSDGSDMYIPIYATGQYAVRLNLPPSEPRFVPWLEPINVASGFAAVQAVASSPSNLELKFNSTVLNTATSVSTISGTATFGANTCDQAIVANGILAAATATDTAKFFITPNTATAPLPAGLQDGINYAANNTEVTLVLFAPNHTSVNVIGDFSNWQSLCAYQMTKTPDGNRYFLKLTGLTPGQLYKFQYVLDGTIKTTDPYTELILDPSNDQYIPAANFPSLPAYPASLTTGIVGTFQTAAPAYTWTTTGYVRPDKKALVMYEIHLRDFLAASNWQTLADTLNYIKGLGVNAIEVMPFNEFEGNNSWGYNPDFFFAPDKAYGTKNKLKQFIDMAHSKGMAVIMDAVLNHTTGLSPLAQMWWNGTTNQPTPNSPYLNQTATHPFSVFNDFNHESDATKYHTARYIRHWLTEYKLDGFRWDLSKGFTQKPCGGDVGCWNAYDATRVAIWQRYYDSSQVVSAGSYCILEHLGNDDEEGDLANRGMLLWGKMTSQYNQNTMGYSANSDINRAFFANRPFWTQPHLVTYAESHDEERLMYKNLNFGNNAVPTHNVTNLNIALSRMEAIQPFLLLIPGPKMIWQFGELGYDRSIFECENGTVPTPYGSDGCKTSPKPLLWNYNADPARKKIYNVIAGLNRIRALKPNAFITNTIGGNLGNDYKKQLIINHPDLKLVAISNFDVVAQPFSVTFPVGGTWYEYFTNNTFTATGSAQTINMLPGEYRVYTNVSFCTTALPIISSPVTYCQNATATPLTATGTGLLWYTVASGGISSSTAPTPSTATVGSTTFYVSQTINGCEGNRASIVVNVTTLPAAPVVTSPVTYCQNTTATTLTAAGSNLKWYTVASGGSASTVAPTPSTLAIGTTTYYVSQTTGGCESPRATILVNITASTPAPVVTSTVTYCQNATATTLTATGTSLLWYNAAAGGTGTATAPTPSTTTAGNTTYYVSQTTSCGEGPRATISVIVNATPAAPTVTPTIAYCQNATATALTATGTGILWYNAAAGGTSTATAPTPSTTAAGTTNYYASQTINGCEGPRASITVTVTATPAAPTVVTPVTYCQNSAAVALSATGTNLLWYSTAAGGGGTATAPTPITTTIGSNTYYVSQTVSSCEGPRAAILVNIVASTPAPIVTSTVTYCQNATATAVFATGVNLLWYNAAAGGTGTATAPTPSTTTAGTTTFYVSQTTSCGEGPRAAINVVVNATPAAPTVTPTIAYCQNATATALTATGTVILWYNAAVGGTSTATAPTPSTTAAGTTNYYASQTINGCEGPRSVIAVVVTATPAAPTVVTPVTYCQNSTAVALSATGTNLLWYSTAAGGGGTATAPTPITTTIGSNTYYVSQTVSTCEGPRSAIVVNIIASTPAPVVTSPVTYCQNATATAVFATGVNLLWYNAAAGGTGTATAPTPSTTTAGTTTFYVSQTTSCGEGPRAAINVVVNATPTTPIVSSTVTYCQTNSVISLTAIGTNLLWYNAASGGTGSSITPSQNISTAGSTSYFVSQTINGCEGPRSVTALVVTATPAAPTVVTPVTYCQNATALQLSAIGTNLQWYPVANGGTASVVAPTPVTTANGTFTFYVSSTLNSCESPRAAIIVNVTASPTAPTVTATISYCQNDVATALTATGSSLLWFTTASGSTGTATAPTPSTTTAGTTNYYVSQTTSCGEGPRALIAVTVTATPSVPTNLSAVNITNNSTSLTWSGNAGSFYEVQYKTSTSSTWITAATGITLATFNLTGLTDATSYEWRVSANCSATANTNYTTSSFTTTAKSVVFYNVRNGYGLKVTPNPLRSNAKLDYQLPASGNVIITLLNSNGQQAGTIFTGSQNAGKYEIDISKIVSTLAKGVYIIRLQQNGDGNSIRFVKY